MDYFHGLIYVLLICLFLYRWYDDNRIEKEIKKLKSDLQYFKDSHVRYQNYNDFVIDLACRIRQENLSADEIQEKLKEYVVEELNISWEELWHRRNKTWHMFQDRGEK